MKVRPIATVLEGVVEAMSQVRSWMAGIQFMFTLAEERAPLKQVAVIHPTMPLEADDLAEKVRSFVSNGIVLRARFGPMFGAYVGLGTMGIAMQREET